MLEINGTYPRRFNSQPRKGADADVHDLTFEDWSFNSQPRKGADDGGAKRMKIKTVSTHSPARGLTRFVGLLIPSLLRFNSQPRKGADLRIPDTDEAYQVSTHSPARGLTYGRRVFGRVQIVSTHSPARGLTSAA